MNATWRLVDVVDCEAQLALDRIGAHAQGGQATGLDQRDREIGAGLAESAGSEPTAVSDDALLLGWVRAMRERSDALPGQRLLTTLAALRALALVLALAGGVALASAALHYDGSRPISILTATGLLVLLPSATLLVTLLLQLPGLRRLFAATGGPVQWLLAHAVMPWLRRALPAGPPGYHAALLGNLARRDGGHLVYGPVWRSVIGEVIQLLGLVLVAAALATVVLRVVFTDLAFAWGSTLQVDVDWMQRLVGVLAAPWGWLWPEAVPDRSLIEASQYNRLEDSFAGGEGATRAVDAQALGGWWSFLVANIAVWALLPRLLTTLWFVRQRHRALAGQAERSARLVDHQDQVQRLRDAGPRFRRSAGDTEPTTPAPDPTVDGDWPTTGPAVVIVWDEACDEAAARAVMAPVLPIDRLVQAGHDVDAAVDRAVITGISAANPGPVVLLVDGAEQPLADILAFLRDLTQAAGRRPLLVVLLEPAPANLARWQQATRPLDLDIRQRSRP